MLTFGNSVDLSTRCCSIYCTAIIANTFPPRNCFNDKRSLRFKLKKLDVGLGSLTSCYGISRFPACRPLDALFFQSFMKLFHRAWPSLMTMNTFCSLNRSALRLFRTSLIVWDRFSPHKMSLLHSKVAWWLVVESWKCCLIMSDHISQTETSFGSSGKLPTSLQKPSQALMHSPLRLHYW